MNFILKTAGTRIMILELSKLLKIDLLLIL